MQPVSASSPQASKARKSRSDSDPSRFGKLLSARFGLAIVVAIALHLPATPVMMVFKFVSSLIDIRDADRVDYAASQQPPIAVELADLPPPPPAANKPKEKVDSVQMESAEPPRPDIKIPKGEEQPRQDPEAERADKPEEKVTKKKPEDLGLAGEMSKSVQGKTNVTLTVWFDSMRSHPLGGSMKPLLSCGFLGSTFQRAQLDPMQDLEGVMFAGSQISDPSNFTVAVHHKMKAEALHDAIDRLVKHRGSWIDKSAAKIHVAKANRMVFPHERSLVFVTPERGWQQIRAIAHPLSIPAGKGRAVALSLLKPSIPLRKLGVRLPESLVEMRVDVYLSVTGTAEVRMVFEDRDETSATSHTPVVQRQVRDFIWQVEQLGAIAGMLGKAPAAVKLPRLDFSPDENTIVASATLTQEQTESLLGKLPAMMCPPPKAGASTGASAQPSAAIEAPPAASSAAPNASTSP